MEMEIDALKGEVCEARADASRAQDFAEEALGMLAALREEMTRREYDTAAEVAGAISDVLS
jgi:hypothetical protein